MTHDTAYLCKCLKCDVVLIDENHQFGAPELLTDGNELEMEFIEDKDGGMWVCPVCHSDGNLVDLPQDE